MTFTIAAYDEAEGGDGFQRFHFVMDARDCERRAGCVTLRTAQGLANEIARESGLARMLRAIATTVPRDFESLVGKQFADM